MQQQSLVVLSLEEMISNESGAGGVMKKRPWVWIEQKNEQGLIFRDHYLHRECSYLRQWESRAACLKETGAEFNNRYVKV